MFLGRLWKIFEVCSCLAIAFICPLAHGLDVSLQDNAEINSLPIFGDSAADLNPTTEETSRIKSDNRADWPGIRRDLYYLFGYQVVAAGILYVGPESISGWDKDDDSEPLWDKWKQNIRHVAWDNDGWHINYLWHPYWGATYYIRARERGFDKAGAFWISALFSASYEYGIESFMEEPSIQDLIATPVLGTLVGFYFEHVRERIENKPGPRSRFDRVLMGASDPLGYFNNLLNGWFGIEEHENRMQVGFGYQNVVRLDNKVRGGYALKTERVAAISFHYRW
jgi:hypothetical protein